MIVSIGADLRSEDLILLLSRFEICVTFGEWKISPVHEIEEHLGAALTMSVWMG